MDLALKPEDEAFAGSLRQWLKANLEPVPAFVDVADEVAWGRRWQATLASARWVGVHWPTAYGGRSATPVQVALYQTEYARSQAPQPVNRVGINLVGPTLLAHGTEDQRLRHLPRILSAEEIWCQLFSEPDAGSDLASLATKAAPVEGGYLVTGRKVWTSYAAEAQHCFLLARVPASDGESAGRAAIVILLVDMRSPGIQVKTIPALIGEGDIHEVFFDAVFVPDCERLGGEGQARRERLTAERTARIEAVTVFVSMPTPQKT